MRHILITLAALALTLLSTTMQLHAKDDNGHTLTALWKTFYSARDNDRPKDEAKILEEIKKEALAKDLAWDYYDACREYLESRSRSNWKLYDKLQEEFSKEMEKKAPPVAVFFYRLNYGDSGKNSLAFLEDNKARMLREHNPEFYLRDHNLSNLKFSEAVYSLLTNDYEYALFSLYADRWDGDGQIAYAAKSYFAGRYPLDAFADYIAIKGKDGRGAFIERYNGKAAALLAEEDDLCDRFSALKADSSSGQDRFLALDKACGDFISRRSSFSKSEKQIADCCELSDQISKALKAQKIGINIKDGESALLLRNVGELTVSIKTDDEKSTEVFNRKITNPTSSFYVTDTVNVDLSTLSDGDYIIYGKASGAESSQMSYRKHSLSMAWRQESAGTGVFVADYLSGKPVEKADFTVRDRSGKIISEAKGLQLDGFTCLPGEVVKSIESASRGCTIQSSYKDGKGMIHSSFKQSIRINDSHSSEIDEESVRCVLMTDRSAFNPEETVHFKAILYKGWYRYKTCGAGLSVKAVLAGTKGEELAKLELKTDDFGAADGEFMLPRTDNNGTYTITISLEDGSRPLASCRIRVDDFVLPTFDLIWNVNENAPQPGDTVRLTGNIKSYSGHNLGTADISYSVEKFGTEIKSGSLATDRSGDFTIEFPTDADDSWQNYRVSVKAVDSTGETKEFSTSVYVSKNRCVQDPEEYYFKRIENEQIALKAVAGSKTTWAVAELFTTGDKLLEKKLIRFEPAGGANAETIIRFGYKDSYPDVVSLNVIYFQNGDSHEYTLEARRPDESWKLPLSFTRFLDTTAPGAEYTFSIKTAAGVQCTATIFDKSTETVQPNRWTAIHPQLLPAPYVRYISTSGSDRCSHPIHDDWIGRGYGNMIAYGSTKGGRMLMSAKTMATADMAVNAMADNAEIETEEAIPFQLTGNSEAASGYIRENFANTIAWEPCLLSDKDGIIRFSFINADKLSTYYVQLFAHDRYMRNAVLRREMKVTLPVKIAVIEPQILYDGDRYVMRATLSNSTSADVPGKVSIEFMDGTDYKTAGIISSEVGKIIVPAGGSASVEKEIHATAIRNLGIKLAFTPDENSLGADGVFVSVPVLPTVQAITEAHSSLLFSGEDKDALIAKLRGLFVNIPGEEASVQERSILELLNEAVPQRVEPKGDNAVALTEALYAGMLADGLNGKPMTIDQDSEILAKIMKLQTAEGGFAWFDGMESSPLVTCLVLERFHRMGITKGISAAVSYLDDVFFHRDEQPYWRGWISREQYLYIRSLYAGEEFSSKGIDTKFWKEFRKAAKNYLAPGKVRGLNGAVFAKARRVETLRNLTSSEAGLQLASKWGVKFATGSRLENSLSKDIESLAQYAEPHKSGGMYFPNAVMPFRGLLESEAYAHSHLCRLMSETGHDDIADGIRLWLMVQKETQAWDSDPGYLEALNAVFEGSEQMLATKVIALKGSTSLPFEQVKASGNGFTIERQYFKDGKQIADGEILKAGDKITAKYKVWNEENRSFVKLTAPRNAALKPVDQLSGYHWGYYRNVLKDRTEFWYQSYPEENTEVQEVFYVQQSGSFQSAALEIICEYADHYRANDLGRKAMAVSQ